MSDDGKRAAWTDEPEAADEPPERSDRRPAWFYAPQGQCIFCDRRRQAAAKSMRAVRERGEA